MALKALHKEVKFGVGDTVRVYQSIAEGDKKRLQAFEGMVIAIRGEGENKSFTVRRIGPAQVGIEKIFPLLAPVVDKIEVVRVGGSGVRRAKLYFTRTMPKKEVERIYQRTTWKTKVNEVKKPKKVKKVEVKKALAKKVVKTSKKDSVKKSK